MMKRSDFKILPKDVSVSFFTWRGKRRLNTPCGAFSIALVTQDAIDDEMVKLADQLARYAQSHSEYIREIIYGYYLYFVTEFGPGSVECSDVPANLGLRQIWKYCEPGVVVDRLRIHGLPVPRYLSMISANPQWEPEHNLTLHFSDGAIRTVDDSPFEIVGGILRYKPVETTVEKPPQAAPAEMLSAYANGMGAMAEQLKAMTSGKTEERQRWEKLFPAPPPGTRVETDPSVIYGDWKLDPGETASVLTKLGEKTSVVKARKQWSKYIYRISRNTLTTLAEGDLVDEQSFRECRRRGNRFDFVLHPDSIWEHWFDGKILVDQCGLAYRRAS